MEIDYIKNFLLLVVILKTQFGISQKEGSFFISDSPVDNISESIDEPSGGDTPIPGMTQQFFFLIPDGSKTAMMVFFKMEDYGFACPTCFTSYSR